MNADLLRLADRLAKLRKSIPESASKLAVETAVTIVGDLAFKTPVDTSKALSSWIATLDSPSQDRPGPNYPGKHGSTYKASAAEAINKAKAALAGKKPGQLIFITNNQPYIKRLNEGYSGQQPAGFVERAVLLGRKMQSKFKLGDW